MAKRVPYTRLTLEWLRKHGYTAGLVERRLPGHKGQLGGGRLVDLFGCIDVVCLHPEVEGVVGIQSTSDGAGSAHVKKILAEPLAREWVERGNPLVMLCWQKRAKLKKDGRPGNAMIWHPRVFRFTDECFNLGHRPIEVNLL